VFKKAKMFFEIAFHFTWNFRHKFNNNFKQFKNNFAFLNTFPVKF
jgi:hypothetical protein